MSQIFPEREDISKIQVSHLAGWLQHLRRRGNRKVFMANCFSFFHSPKLIYKSQIYISSRGSRERWQGFGTNEQNK